MSSTRISQNAGEHKQSGAMFIGNKGPSLYNKNQSGAGAASAGSTSACTESK